MSEHTQITKQQRKILQYIDAETRRRGYPPSVREICKAVNLKSPSSAHYHLKRLQENGWLQRDKTSLRALRVNFDWQSGMRGERRPTRHVPFVSDTTDLASITKNKAGKNKANTAAVEALYPLPADLTGDGELIMLRMNDDSMIDAGILDGDYLVVTSTTSTGTVKIANGKLIANGDLVVAGSEPVVRRYRSRGNTVWLEAANPAFESTKHKRSEVNIYGRVVTVVRQVQPAKR